MNEHARESTLSTYTAMDGDNLAVQDWPLAPERAPRGMVLIVHGLGEHAGRYDHVARQLNHWGFAVRGYDHYGHGDSGGLRGALPSDMRLIDDLADLMDSTRARTEPGTPLLLLGHSMGGLVASCLVAQRVRPLDGLILSSPAFDPGLGTTRKVLLAVLHKLAPGMAVANSVDPALLSHDAGVVAAYKSDPLVHDRVTARLARFIVDHSAGVLAQAPHWHVPTLLMYAGADRVVNPEGSRMFAQAAPREVVTVRRFEALFHEIFNEADAQPVFGALGAWLDAHFPEPASSAVAV
ncbi:alpha/beta hydrolase [Ramlibacter sp.]|uniref:alpha/beta hydrolase n=1 Tax=Ramlibacter sp. TaxID=1917967 RepID=UPI0017D6439A|nr:alpha/beta hydrolase [Ramlibacter sp.]MBA2673562.1 alpha/beta hydrolase [Ramlibacter sp.]